MTPFSVNPALQIGTVFESSAAGVKVILDKNLSELTRSYEGTVYSIGNVGSILKIHFGRKILFAMVRLLRLAVEETEAKSENFDAPSRRIVEADIIGEGLWSGDEELRFDRGVKTYPLPLMPVFLMTNNESRQLFSAIEGARRSDADSLVPIGRYVGGATVECRANIDKLFGQHCAVLGSTGSGKSTAVSAILHAVLEHRGKGGGGLNPRVVLIDPHNEYAPAFGARAIRYRAYDSVVPDDEGGAHIRLPYWLMTGDEFRQLVVGKTEFEATSQANVVYKALAHARMVSAKLIEPARDDWGGKSTSSIPHPDQPRPLPGISSEAIASFDRDRPQPFCLDEFERHIVHEQAMRDTKGVWGPVTPSAFQEDFSSILDKLRFLRSDARVLFMMKNYDSTDLTLNSVLAQFVGAGPGHDPQPIRIVDISGLPTEVAGPLTGAIARLLFTYKISQTKKEREQDPVLLICEEAHRYVPDRGEALYATAQAAIRRIAREGRKYGLGLMLVSQRPSDVESTVISQCNSWIILRLTNATDQEHVARCLPDTLAGLTRILSSLPRREALFVGEAAPLPSRIQLRFLEGGKRPHSNDISFVRGWSTDFPSAVTLQEIANRLIR